jgi:hypothetical protein
MEKTGVSILIWACSRKLRSFSILFPGFDIVMAVEEFP